MVVEPNILNTTFQTKWGMFAFRWMSFGLINISETFQHAMDISFCRVIGQSIVVYLDDVIVFYKQWPYYIFYLKTIFERWHKYGISLNPNKSIFTVSEGNLLRHIIAKNGIKIDLDRVRMTMQIPFLVNKQAMQCFLGKMNFLHKCISDYT